MRLEELQEILACEGAVQIEKLTQYLVSSSVSSELLGANSPQGQVYLAIVEKIVNSQQVSLKEKVDFMESINSWGDPRLSTPADANYWREVQLFGVSLHVGRFPVTTQEWLRFLETDYHVDAHWSAEGLAWRNNHRTTWQQLAAAPDSAKYILPNQPVVGVSWFEAEAFATSHGARLMDFMEREEIVRGVEKRRYPWGQDYKHGYANTEEVGLQKSAPVGIFVQDATPEGIYDMAGNVAEWQGDDMDEQRLVHPGSWAQGSISTWAKASEKLNPNVRLAYLGFRLVKD